MLNSLRDGATSPAMGLRNQEKSVWKFVLVVTFCFQLSAAQLAWSVSDEDLGATPLAPAVGSDAEVLGRSVPKKGGESKFVSLSLLDSLSPITPVSQTHNFPSPIPPSPPLNRVAISSSSDTLTPIPPSTPLSRSAMSRTPISPLTWLSSTFPIPSVSGVVVPMSSTPISEFASRMPVFERAFVPRIDSNKFLVVENIEEYQWRALDLVWSYHPEAEIILFGNGENALAFLRTLLELERSGEERLLPGVILIATNFSTMKGWELVSRIRETPEYDDILVIGHPQFEDIGAQRMREAGANEVLLKTLPRAKREDEFAFILENLGHVRSFRETLSLDRWMAMDREQLESDVARFLNWFASFDCTGRLGSCRNRGCQVGATFFLFQSNLIAKLLHF